MQEKDPSTQWICESCGAVVELDDVGRPRPHWRRAEDPSVPEPSVRCATSGARRLRDAISRAPDNRPRQMKRGGSDGEVDGQGKLFK